MLPGKISRQVPATFFAAETNKWTIVIISKYCISNKQNQLNRYTHNCKKMIKSKSKRKTGNASSLAGGTMKVLHDHFRIGKSASKLQINDFHNISDWLVCSIRELVWPRERSDLESRNVIISWTKSWLISSRSKQSRAKDRWPDGKVSTLFISRKGSLLSKFLKHVLSWSLFSGSLSWAPWNRNVLAAATGMNDISV